MNTSPNRFVVALEGLDGCGKSTVAPLLHALLQTGIEAPTSYHNKKEILSNDKYLQAHANYLRQMLWSKDVPSTDPFDPRYWLLLTASWYRLLTLDRSRSRQITHVFDGWYFRSIAKSISRSHLTKEELLPLFHDVMVPTHIVLLDVPPHEIQHRGRTFNAAEKGNWAHDRFDCHQFALRKILMQFAQEAGWLLYSPRAGESPETTAVALFHLVTQN